MPWVAVSGRAVERDDANFCPPRVGCRVAEELTCVGARAPLLTTTIGCSCWPYCGGCWVCALGTAVRWVGLGGGGGVYDLAFAIDEALRR